MRNYRQSFHVFIAYACIIVVLISCKSIDNTSKQSDTTHLRMDKIVKTEQEWKDSLSPIEYHVTRERGTERAFTGQYWNHFEKGVYTCVCCHTDLFSSDTKFDAGCGWPSFFQPINIKMVKELEDREYGMIRTEVRCNKCDAHLGHVFDDGPPPTGLRYCINSASIRFKKN